MSNGWRPTVLAILLAISLGIVPLAVDSAQAAFPADTSEFWPLDDAQQTAPGIYLEEIAPINNGTCRDIADDSSCPTAIAGAVDGAQMFDGAVPVGAADGIDVAANAAFDFAATDSFSIGVWIRRDPGNPIALDDAEVAIARDEGPGGLFWWLGINSDDGAATPTSNVATFVLSDTGAVGPKLSNLGLLGATDLADGAYHYLVGVRDVTVDGDEANDFIILYVDGVEVARSTVGESAYTGFDALTPLTIGYLDFNSGSVAGSFFTGDIDEVALFSTALSAAEVLQVYNNGLSGISLRAAVVPLADDDAFATLVNTVLTQPAPGVLDGDTTGTTATKLTDPAPASGTLTAFNADGSFTFTPAANFTGDATFTYAATDATGTNSLPATVTITVSATPVATDDTYTTPAGTDLNEAAPGVLTNDTPAATRTVALGVDVTNGTLTLNADGSFLYVPDPGFTGVDAFTYSFTDGVGTSNPATVTITVGLVAVDDTYATTVGTILDEPAPGVLVNDTPGTTAVLVADVTDGVLVLNADGSFVYTPNPLFDGTDTFTYTANAGGGASNVATVSIDVTNPIPPIVRGGGGGGGCFIMTAGD